MLTRRGFFGALAALGIVPRAINASATPPIIPTSLIPTGLDNLTVYHSIDRPTEAEFTAPQGTYRVGEPCVIALGGEIGEVFRGVVVRIDTGLQRAKVFAVDPTPIDYEAQWRHISDVQF